MRKFENLYYYWFYLLTRFVHKSKKSDSDGAFTALLWLSLPMVLNLLSIKFLFDGIGFRESKFRIYLICISIIVHVVAMNYCLMMRNGKHGKIKAYFEEKFKERNHHNRPIVLLLIFVLLSIVICTHLAMLNREKFM